MSCVAVYGQICAPQSSSGLTQISCSQPSTGDSVGKIDICHPIQEGMDPLNQWVPAPAKSMKRLFLVQILDPLFDNAWAPMWKVGGPPLQPSQADNLLNLIIERSVSTAAARRRCLCKIQLFMHYSNFGAVVQIGNSPHLLHTALCGDGAVLCVLQHPHNCFILFNHISF